MGMMVTVAKRNQTTLWKELLPMKKKVILFLLSLCLLTGLCTFSAIADVTSPQPNSDK